MAKPESNLQTKIRKALESKGAWAVKFHGSPFTKKGTPDLLVCYRGLFIGMEVKLPGKEGTLTELQSYQIRKIKEAGGISLVITSVSQALKVLQIVDKKIRNKG
ncbi:MAG: VRR-NUC domain-containing protein [Tissierellaceae bacterium]|nr:VRR-NUC domain-containing protein [Tissierellaceae bacterium]